MQRLARNLIVMALVGIAIFIADLSPASCNEFIHDGNCLAVTVNHDDKKDPAFWDKFRDSVKPREDNHEKPHDPPPKDRGDHDNKH